MNQPDKNIRDTLADAATRLFCEKGYASASVNEIAQAAGITKPVLYYYFGSKAGLFTTLFDEHFSHFNQQLREARSHQGPVREKLEKLFRGHLEYCVEHPERVRFIFNIVFGPQKGHPPVRFDELNQEATVNFSQILDDAKKNGEIRELPNLNMGLAIVGTLNMYMSQQLRAPDWSSPANAAKSLVDIFLGGILSTTSEKK